MQVASSKVLVQSVGVAQVTQCSPKLTYTTRPDEYQRAARRLVAAAFRLICFPTLRLTGVGSCYRGPVTFSG
jgi:hypothetical protein